MPSHRRHIAVLAAGWLIAANLAGCAPANERPLRGAQPGTQAPTPPGVPPTLQASEALRFRALPSPSPAIALSPSPAASPSAVAAPPIVRSIVPSANAHVPAGAPVTLSAVLVGRGADLASASMAIDGADAGAQIDRRSPRDWTIHASRAVVAGPHTVRVLVRDAAGGAGGFTWQFLVGEEGVGSEDLGSRGTPGPSPSQTPQPATRPANP